MMNWAPKWKKNEITKILGVTFSARATQTPGHHKQKDVQTLFDHVSLVAFTEEVSLIPNLPSACRALDSLSTTCGPTVGTATRSGSRWVSTSRKTTQGHHMVLFSIAHRYTLHLEGRSSQNGQSKIMAVQSTAEMLGVDGKLVPFSGRGGTTDRSTYPAASRTISSNTSTTDTLYLVGGLNPSEKY